MSPRLQFALEAARVAGESTLGLFRNPEGFELKSDHSPVTAADKRAEEIIRERVEKHFPGETVLGEEQGLTGQGLDRWVIDPIDGTKSFIAGVPLYSTLLSWEEGGEPVLGVTDFPALGFTVYAEKGGGAFCNGEPCRVQDVADLSRAIICHGSLKSLRQYGRLDSSTDLGSKALAVKGWSDAYGHMLVATGRAHLMIDPVVSRWDLSAVAVIVREAGGVFSDFSGGRAITNEAISCVPGLYGEVMEAFRA